MTRDLRRWLLLFVSLVAISASAKPGDPPKVLPFAAHGAFVGDEWRFRRDKLVSGFITRLGADLISIPTGMPWWSPSDWAIFTGTLGSTIALSVVTTSGERQPWSVDTRFQNFLTYELLGGEDHFKVWGPIGDALIWSSVAVAMIASLTYGLVARDDLATEVVALSFEAALVAQLYHQMIKLATGRSGPQRPEMYGWYYGPGDVASNGGTWLWPQGTPSGHMATMYAMLSVLMYVYDHPALWVGLNAFALIFGASLVGDNYHWLSDVTFGAAIGFCVGRWVVRHRSSLYRYGVDAKPGPRFDLAPLLVPSQGLGGVGVVGTF